MIPPGGIRNKACPPGAIVPLTGYTHRWMDPLDHLLAFSDGHRCTVCDERVPVERVKLLAWRDDLAFLELDCDACLSTTLGFVLGGRGDEPAPARPADPISSDDVLDMHQLLAAWRGDLAGLLGTEDRGRAESSR